MWPQHRRQVTLLQVTPISRGEVARYRSLRRELEALAGRTNGKYAEFDWSPIRYLNKPVQRQMLAGFYRHARIGLVMPLDERRDRWQRMRTALGHTTQRDWSRRFLKALGEARAALRPAGDATA